MTIAWDAKPFENKIIIIFYSVVTLRNKQVPANSKEELIIYGKALGCYWAQILKETAGGMLRNIATGFPKPIINWYNGKIKLFLLYIWTAGIGIGGRVT